MASGRWSDASVQSAVADHSVVNALSTRLKAQVQRDGRTWTQEYRRGQPTGEITPGRPTQQHGTTISFTPDPQIFPTIEYNFDQLAGHLKQLAYLNRDLALNFKTSNAPTSSTAASPPWSGTSTAIANPSRPPPATSPGRWTTSSWKWPSSTTRDTMNIS